MCVYPQRGNISQSVTARQNEKFGGCSKATLVEISQI